jgi:hypothetical protein
MVQLLLLLLLLMMMTTQSVGCKRSLSPSTQTATGDSCVRAAAACTSHGDRANGAEPNASSGDHMNLNADML